LAARRLKSLKNKLTIGRFGLALLIITLVSLTGCYQGRPSKKPPIHVNPNMDNQPKYKAQAESKFFADGATMRIPVEGTVARGELREDVEYYTGKKANGDFVEENQRPVDMQLLKRGQERFEIYCSPCHGRVGNGQGIVVSRGMLPPPTFHSDSLRAYPDGRIFDVITNGIRNMSSYAAQIPVEDRWAIIAYVRALQRSQHATIDDVPVEKREKLQ
jgi:mono/diheme cytochrome c family protein